MKMLVELVLIVIEHEQRSRMPRRANHPFEVAFLPRTDKAALQDPDHELHSIRSGISGPPPSRS
jgi:hypothetical protein